MTSHPIALPVLTSPASHLRWLHVRQVEPGSDHNYCHALNLWWIALAAAEETAQGFAMASSFLTLFSGHLSQSDRQWLRWGDDMATSAEVRRAYSALYGRFFARALLKRARSFRSFVPLHTKSTSTAAATINRVVEGDIPDWVAWDPKRGGYVLCDAKGNLTGSTPGFLTGIPKCVLDGKKQFSRVEVVDLHGNALMVQGWVGASLWATDHRDRKPVFLAYDPPLDGRRIPDREQPEHAIAILRQWLASLSDGLAVPGLKDRGEIDGPVVKIRVSASAKVAPSDLPFEPSKVPIDVKVDQSSPNSHAGLYVPGLLTRFGFESLHGRDASDRLFKAQETAMRSGEPAWFVGLNRRATTRLSKTLQPWESEHGVVSAEGLAIFDLRFVSIIGQYGS